MRDGFQAMLAVGKEEAGGPPADVKDCLPHSLHRFARIFGNHPDFDLGLAARAVVGELHEQRRHPLLGQRAAEKPRELKVTPKDMEHDHARVFARTGRAEILRMHCVVVRVRRFDGRGVRDLEDLHCPRHGWHGRLPETERVRLQAEQFRHLRFIACRLEADLTRAYTLGGPGADRLGFGRQTSARKSQEDQTA